MFKFLLTQIRFVRLDTPDAIGLLQDIKNEHLTYMVWKKVPVEINGKTKEKMNIVNVKTTKEDLLALMKEEIVEFKDHVERVKNQYNQVKQLKEILPSNHAMVQMDFAEDYKCQSQDEIQSAYWNATQVTLHPTVVYYKEENTLEHKSFVFVSDEPAHNASTVFAILEKLVPEIKKIVPNVDMVHYWIDSPTSQYRNKSIFSIVCNHRNWLDGGGAIWNYFEAGHGKGRCDGIGGTAKRLADDAIKQEKAIIQDAHEFFAWANETQSSSLITYIFVSADECQESQRELSDKTKDLVRVQGTMKLHAVCTSGKASVRVRNTSCYCLNCFKDGNFSWGCRGWTLSCLEKQKKTRKLPVHLEPTPVAEDIIQEDGTTTTNAEPADEIVQRKVIMWQQFTYTMANPILPKYKK